MNNPDKIMKIFEEIKRNNIEKIRKINNDNEALNEYFFVNSQKIYKKFTSAYFRMNILYFCLEEIKNSENLYKNTEVKKNIGFILKKADKMLLFADNILSEAAKIQDGLELYMLPDLTTNPRTL